MSGDFERRSSFTNLELVTTEIFQSQGFYLVELPGLPVLGAFYNHHTLHVVHFSQALSYVALC
jgi:hypothetical protein